MKIISLLLIAFVALEHLYILYMEMFAWETLGKKAFKSALAPELFKPTKGLAANQGLYNGFLSAGLIWSFFISNPIWQSNIAIFFLSCVIVAGLYGAYSASKKIFYVQALPAIIALIFTLLATCSDHF
jgi:putative membrane protein